LVEADTHVDEMGERSQLPLRSDARNLVNNNNNDDDDDDDKKWMFLHVLLPVKRQCMRITRVNKTVKD